VLEYAPAAGARAARLGAHRQAAEQYARALRHADVLPPEQQAELYDRLAVERHLLGDGLDEALAAAQAALSIRRSLGQRAEEADALRFSARVLWFMGRTREAKAAALEAVAILETLPPGAKLARAYAGLARIENLAYRLDAARAWSLKAIDLAQELGALEIMSSALNSLGSVQLSVGDEEGWTSLERSLELARASDSEDDVARALLNRASLALELHRYACAERFFAQAMTYTDGRELWSYRGFMLGLRARLHLDRGQWDAALADAEVALRSARSFPVSRVTALSVIGLVSARRGQSDHWPALDEALSLAAPDELQQIAMVAAARAEAAWLGRDYEAVADFTELAYPVACERRAARFAGELAYWRFKAGIVEDVPTWLPEPYALHIRGDWLAAALRWLELGCPYEAALALTESDEVEPTRRGLEEFHRLGALPAARAATARLRRLGATVISRGPRRATLSSPAQLTRRQLEIVQLLVDGLTNAQIAAHLYISPKTVDHHVSAVLGKLGVRSRKDAAAEAVRLGIVGPIAS
jgi:DNA-binding CsgD family transcriptional regulator/tetratricopeptide (TPR) repeat protein